MTQDQVDENLERIATSAHRIAEDGYKLFRLNLIITGIILSASIFLFKNTPKEIQQGVITSRYTHFSVAALIVSTIIGFLTYEPARRLSAMWLYEEPRSLVEKHSTERLSFNIRYGMLLSLISLVAFGVGVIEGMFLVDIELSTLWGIFFIFLLIGALPIFGVGAYRWAKNWATKIFG